MHEHVTLLPPETRREEGGLSSSLPPDLLEQVRGRVRLLTMLILIAFAFDPVLYFLAWSVATVANVPLTAGSFPRTGFMALSAGAAGASALLWWAAGNRKVSETLSCLAKDPTERPQSAKELSGRVGEINGAGVWTEDRAREWWSRHQPAGASIAPIERITHTRKQVCHAVPEGTHRAYEPSGFEAG